MRSPPFSARASGTTAPRAARAHPGVGEDPADGEDHTVWAGVLPLAVRAGVPIPGDISGDNPVDASVVALSARLDRLAADREARIATVMRVAPV
ncbi:hypothetical protein [Curtobacterium sp. VKM Ac-1376]|uniref:hypothetical protein n=1 Tax=Curtobacterium sp. VKM Ac-1376 TaxID=123312 RepID=UPI00188ADF47|nr:hypothetical protein [Curtobacterium sp. VKM Ac-1376]MBF4616130.1 hypothetical protein [Curtobacterium sp. VKM Ac-1376]